MQYCAMIHLSVDTLVGRGTLETEKTLLLSSMSDNWPNCDQISARPQHPGRDVQRRGGLRAHVFARPPGHPARTLGRGAVL